MPVDGEQHLDDAAFVKFDDGETAKIAALTNRDLAEKRAARAAAQTTSRAPHSNLWEGRSSTGIMLLIRPRKDRDMLTVAYEGDGMICGVKPPLFGNDHMKAADFLRSIM